MRILSILLPLLSLIFTTAAQGRDMLGLSVGAFYYSQMMKRGLAVYEGYQVLPVVTLDIYPYNLLIAGNTLHWKHHLDQDWLLRSSFTVGAVPDKPFYETNADILEPVRKTSHEWNLGLDYSYQRGELWWRLSQDVSAHFGFHNSVGGRLALTRHLVGDQPIEPSLTLEIGHGDGRHNEYLYASERTAAPTFMRLSFAVYGPPKVDTIFPLLEIAYSRLISSEVRNGSRVKDTEEWQIYVIWATRLF